MDPDVPGEYRQRRRILRRPGGQRIRKGNLGTLIQSENTVQGVSLLGIFLQISVLLAGQ